MHKFINIYTVYIHTCAYIHKYIFVLVSMPFSCIADGSYFCCQRPTPLMSLLAVSLAAQQGSGMSPVLPSLSTTRWVGCHRHELCTAPPPASQVTPAKSVFILFPSHYRLAKSMKWPSNQGPHSRCVSCYVLRETRLKYPDTGYMFLLSRELFQLQYVLCEGYLGYHGTRKK